MMTPASPWIGSTKKATVLGVIAASSAAASPNGIVLKPVAKGPKPSRESGSLEQDADMVILLNRPDAFERDDPRGGEADLILAKHRNGPTKTVTVAHQLHLSRFTNMAR